MGHHLLAKRTFTQGTTFVNIGDRKVAYKNLNNGTSRNLIFPYPVVKDMKYFFLPGGKILRISNLIAG